MSKQGEEPQYPTQHDSMVRLQLYVVGPFLASPNQQNSYCNTVWIYILMALELCQHSIYNSEMLFCTVVQ